MLNRKGTKSTGIAIKKRKKGRSRCKITPNREKCSRCNKRKVRHHHNLCDYCWNGIKTGKWK